MAKIQWVDGPWKLIELPSATKSPNDHPAYYIANEMAFAHNCMLRGLNAIYLQAPHIPPADVPDFLFFIKSWGEWIAHHHHMEETMMFPGFESIEGVAKGSLQGNVDQHHAFSGGLEAITAYATKTPAVEYSGIRVKGLCDAFGDALSEHLADEISTLLAMDTVPHNTSAASQLLAKYRESEAHARKQDKTVVPPMILGLCDKTFNGGNDWPKLPFGAAAIVHYVFGRKHAGSWRFLPCDTWRTPRTLMFLGEGNDSTG
ncbi:hypothetical protein P154DRAFT_494699 [Amniculicola lignicola CBS 123094]|uniref:Hemerythrin-like domain-containing protein n=1 Tax=Amniculicola lignicola CBS 123094 TaxID=1392246 RepID=A0A6A5WII5_9PLEO|nr:hypothetical protein P154DRAFT_494699 [Amniculicola lignicola CBS 123094]